MYTNLTPSPKSSFFPLLLFISHGKNNFTAVKLPVLIHIIIIHQKMEKNWGSPCLFSFHTPTNRPFQPKSHFFPLLLFISHGKNNFTAAACTYTYYHYPSENGKKIGGHHAYFPSTPPQIGHFSQKTSFFPLLLFISHGKNNFTAVKLPVLIHIIIIHQKMEKKLGVTVLM